jgi:hypothetical protein
MNTGLPKIRDNQKINDEWAAAFHLNFIMFFVSLGYLNWGAKTWLFFLKTLPIFKLGHLLIDNPNSQFEVKVFARKNFSLEPKF